MEQRKRVRSKKYPKPELALDELTKAVLKAAGMESLWHDGFAILATMIYEGTGKRISVTTLKRVYGFAYRKFKFSGYTLSVLMEFSQSQQLQKTA